MGDGDATDERDTKPQAKRAKSKRKPAKNPLKHASIDLGQTPESAERRLLVESLMARRMRVREIVRKVQETHKAHERTIYTDMDAIRAVWIEESGKVGREARRVELRYAMEDTLQRALDGQTAVMDQYGKPMLRPDGEPIVLPDPNLGAAARLLDTLARLDGLYQFPLELKVQENVEKLLDTVKGRMTREAYEQLVRAIAAASGVAGLGGPGASGD